MNIEKTVLCPVMIVMACAANLFAALNTFPGCQEVTADHFRTEVIAGMADGLWEPMKLDMHMDDAGAVDVYWTERRPASGFEYGRVRVYDASEDAIFELGRLSTGNDPYGDAGVLSIALDPDFRVNGWIYVAYTPPEVEPHMNGWDPGEVVRISRLSVDGHTWDPASETVIIEYPFWLGHSGAGIRFDAYGNLYIATGDTHMYEVGVANTASFVGKILRVKPMAVADGYSGPWGNGHTYSIPAGNFAEYWAGQFDAQGRTALAAQYRDTSLVRPEIFIMGVRNAYHIDVDPVRQWVTFGDCGPDGRGADTEEFTFATYPANAGWPYFAGDNVVITRGFAPGLDEYTVVQTDPQNIQNHHPDNTGVMELPPAMPATWSYGQACAIGGPIYNYDPALDSDVKMPPHFHNLWFFTDWNHSWVHAIRMSEDGRSVVEDERVSSSLFSSVSFHKPIDFQVGPDGAFYLVNYAGYDASTANTSIFRIEYTGPECDVGQDFEVLKAGCMNEGDAAYDPDATHHNPDACGVGTGPALVDTRGRAEADYLSGLLMIHEAGAHHVEVTNAAGRTIWQAAGNGSRTYDIASRLEAGQLGKAITGVLFISVRTESGARLFKDLNI